MSGYEGYETTKYKFTTVVSKETKQGRNVAHTLLRAVAKRAIVDDLDNRIDSLSSDHRLVNGRVEEREIYESLLLEREKEENNLKIRSSYARNVVLGHPELRLTDLYNPEQISVGKLTAVDLREATLELSDDKQKLFRLQFAETIPIPEGTNRTYYGHRLTVMMEVLSISEGLEWVLR